MKREKPRNFNAFLTFLLGDQDDALLGFLHSLNFDDSVKLFKEFGGRTIRIPTAEEFDKALKFFKIVELAKLQNIKVDRKFINSLELSPNDKQEFTRYYNNFHKNFKRMREKLIRGY